ncbi:hypothetical protein [Kouleothrix sp.]|uniref:hypothetical protein n=1 Tax=Kouleothrix sp. TaxID=2779161 RepID=UPI00391BBB29
MDNTTQEHYAQADALIAATFGRVLDEVGPRQAVVLRRCAIPRWFDAEVLAVLRERADGNDRVLAALAAYSFVRPLGEGRYAYQADVRAALLAEWRSAAPGELAAINARLADHFAARAAAEAGRELSLPNLTLTVRPRGDWELWEREALYHRLQADPAAGLAQLRAAFDQAESTYRLADAEALLQAAAEVPLDAGGARWLRYMRARLARSSLRLDDAASQLKALLAEPGLDPALAAATREALGDTLAEQGQWARAIELYRESLEFYQSEGERRRAAEVMLRLGDAYRGLGVNTGGWYVPAFAQNRVLAALGRAWYWLLALPFALLAPLLVRAGRELPRPALLGAYQNWLLARIYRTAQGWYAQARAAFAALGDARGTLLAEQQQAEITLLFGYADAALAELNELRARPAAQTTYRRLWIDAARAAALIEGGDPQAAQALLAELLAGFRALGDARGVAAALALQGRADSAVGAADEALEHYRESLAGSRRLRYTAAREQALYALRAWQRRVGPGPVADEIGRLLEHEPEKRYVARFPRSLLPQLRGLVLTLVPLTLLLAALVAPSTVVRRIGNSPLIELQTFFNLWNVLALVLALGVLGLAVYALVGLGLMFFIPLDALEREQPDYLITDERGIARYDYRGALALRIEWDDIRRWVRVDRRLWQRPMALFSLAFLEAADGSDLRIDGITGWYNGLQRDIALHLRDAGNPTRAEDRGVAIGPSKSGALLLLGALLALACISSENRWSDGLINALPPAVYTLIYLLSFSGLPILIPLGYWFVAQPLAIHRLLSLRDRWPWFVGAAGLLAVALALLGALPIPALNVGLLLWGAYALADALYTLLFPRRPAAGYALIGAALLAAALVAYPQAQRMFFATLNKTYIRREDYDQAESAGSAALPAPDADPSAPDVPNSADAATWQALGNTLYLKGDFAGAVAAYANALEALPQPLGQSSEQAAVILLNRARAYQKLAERQPAASALAQRDIDQACRLAPQLCLR